MDHDHDHGDGGDHGDHGDGGDCMMHMMYMTFHGGYKATILWDSWSTKTVTSFVFSCLGIFLISIAYESLKFMREQIYIKQIQKVNEERRKRQPEQGPENYGSMASLTTQEITVKDRIFNKAHIVQALLHVIQMAISYGLMLVAMTYNYWLFLSLVLGFGFGYLFFGWIRSTVVDKNEHCC
ncbi:hypothetical protein ACFFRR_004863 [Megaselia abdita]